MSLSVFVLGDELAKLADRHLDDLAGVADDTGEIEPLRR